MGNFNERDQERVDDADARVREAELREKELDGKAKESQRESARNAVTKAKREAQDARDDLAEAMTAKPEKNAKGGGKSGGGSLDPFKQLVSIFGGGLLETFGLNGSFLPDLANLAPVKEAGAAMNAIMPALLGGDQGGGGGSGGGLSLSGLIPDAYVPPPAAPDGTGHLTGPGGQPAAPGPIINIDQSMQMNGSTIGWDPEATFKQYNRNAKVSRLPAGVKG